MRSSRLDYGDEPAEQFATQAAARALVINQPQLDEIRQSLRPDKLRRLLELALAELAERPRQIHELAESEDHAQLRNEAHNFMGAVASLGLDAVARAAMAVECAAPGPELLVALRRLDREAVRARMAIAPLLCGLSTDIGPANAAAG